MGVYLLMNIAVIGYFADTIIQEIYKDRDIIEAFTGFLFFFFGFDLIMRFFIQPLSSLSIQPYLTLPIKKSTLFHYQLVKSIPGFFNFLSLLLIIPFFIKVICITKPVLFCLAWVITVVSLIVFNNFLTFYLKKSLLKRPAIILILLAGIASLLYLDINNTITVSAFFSNIFFIICNEPILALIPVIISGASYFLAYSLLKKNSYLDDVRSKRERTSVGFSFLDNYGVIGSLISTEIKLIFRNKRPKSVLFTSMLFLLYGFLMYRGSTLDNNFILIFIGLMLTGSFTLTYGQYMYSWESTFFDCYIANKIDPFNYIKSKYLLFTATNLIGFLITLPYAIISVKIGFINGALLLYNLGVSSFVMLFLGTVNTSRIDLGKSQFMNYEGVGIMQFFMLFPILGPPLLISFLFNLLGIQQYTFYVLGIMGIMGILINRYLIQIIVNRVLRMKYKMAYGFRQK